MAYLNLRQICLAASTLEPVEQAIRYIFGVEVCHRDDGVAKYGLVNALFVFGRQFIEVVAPTRPQTAVERFIERSGGRGAYMAIFDCNNPQQRRQHMDQLGIRIAHELNYPEHGYWGIQLHPRDCRATMIELDRTEGAADLDGPYYPAGADWRAYQRLDLIRGISGITLESPAPLELAQHWSGILETPLTRGEVPGLQFSLGSARFVPVAQGMAEAVSCLDVEVSDSAAVLQRARAFGCRMDTDGFEISGVRFVPHDERRP